MAWGEPSCESLCNGRRIDRWGALKNSWGLTFLGGSPFWISDQATNLATLYAVTGSTTSVLEGD